MSDNPYESPEELGQAAKGTAQPAKFSNILFYSVFGLMMVGMLIALLLPNVRGSREAARRNTCAYNMKQLTLALHNYESAHGALPPAYTVDADGNRLHSWRTLILPYIEGRTVYESIDLSKPWDDPANADARDMVMQIYQCPSATHEETLTTYLAVVGPDCAFSGHVGRTFAEVTDGPENTIALVDVPASRAVHWMSPHDIGPEEILGFDLETDLHHPGLFAAAFLDGRVEPIRIEFSPADLRAMLTIAGGEPKPDLDY